ncbi:uncharacterized protein NEMAJ01_2409, partial [Nematocida major]|uniref:uncharacterized protein n=1 Tax=Nematocida major TaxID=1912982 RepID=UPI0020072D1C
EELESRTTKEIIRVLEKVWYTWGGIDELVSDNGKELVSKSVEHWLWDNGIKHRIISTEETARMKCWLRISSKAL